VIGVCPDQVSDHGITSAGIYVPSHVAGAYNYDLESRQQRVWRLYGRLKPRGKFDRGKRGTQFGL
jgi:hypothetical protein